MKFTDFAKDGEDLKTIAKFVGKNKSDFIAYVKEIEQNQQLSDKEKKAAILAARNEYINQPEYVQLRKKQISRYNQLKKEAKL